MILYFTPEKLRLGAPSETEELKGARSRFSFRVAAYAAMQALSRLAGRHAASEKLPERLCFKKSHQPPFSIRGPGKYLTRRGNYAHARVTSSNVNWY